MKFTKQEQSRKPYLFMQGLLVMLFFVVCLGSTMAAPSADLWPKWQKSSEQNRQTLDHSRWAEILDTYLVSNHPSGINRFRYGDVSGKDRQLLQEYLADVQNVTVTSLNRGEQKAYWINLYNALTVEVILDHYPVKSIMDIDISPGFFSQGPWGAKLFTIEDEKLSLNDIEHRILRPIFTDNRVHYALNCASLGCPNLQASPFTATNMEQMLDAGARAYINHSRGVQIGTGKIQLSSIYKWFKSDFGGTDVGVTDHLLRFADNDLAKTLKGEKKKFSYSYNWDLNE